MTYFISQNLLSLHKFPLDDLDISGLVSRVIINKRRTRKNQVTEEPLVRSSVTSFNKRWFRLWEICWIHRMTYNYIETHMSQKVMSALWRTCCSQTYEYELLNDYRSWCMCQMAPFMHLCFLLTTSLKQIETKFLYSLIKNKLLKLLSIFFVVLSMKYVFGNL